MHILDNPVFYSLQEYHQKFCLNFGDLKAYEPEVLPFGGFKDLETNAQDLSAFSTVTQDFFIIGNSRPKLPEHLYFKKEIICHQMISDQIIDIDIKDKIILLNEKFEEQLYEHITTFYNGFFRKKSSVLGNYYGIFRDERLVAVTGERFQTKDFIEISAVVTHADFTGLGLATQLTAFVNNRIIQNGKTAFLHVDEKNSKAILLYKKLGFQFRDKINVWFIGTKKS